MKRTYILPILLILFAVSGGKPEAQEKPKNSENFQIVSVEKEQVKQTKETKVEKKFQEGDLIFVQYTAKWCGPCQQLKAKVRSSADFQRWLKSNTKGYYYIDIDKNSANVRDWKSKINITSVPTIGLFKRQNDKWKLVRATAGNQSLEALKQMVR